MNAIFTTKGIDDFAMKYLVEVGAHCQPFPSPTLALRANVCHAAPTPPHPPFWLSGSGAPQPPAEGAARRILLVLCAVV